jgi:hypothetical protein
LLTRVIVSDTVGVRHLFGRARKPKEPEPESQAMPQGEEYDVIEAEQQYEDERAGFAEDVIRKAAHRGMPFLDDPFD